MKQTFDMVKDIVRNNHEATRMISQLISTHCLYRIDIEHIVYDIQDGLKVFFKNLPLHPYIEFDESFRNGMNMHYPASLNNNFFDIAFYKGSPIILIMNKNPNGDKRHGSDVERFICTIKSEKHIKNLKELLNKLIHYSMNKMIKQWSNTVDIISVPSIGAQFQHDVRRNFKFRTFDDVFLPKNQKALLQNSLRNYVSKREWYDKNNIPNHFGVLLHGCPGGGKSSIAQAIANDIHAELFIVNGDDVARLPELFTDGHISRTSQSKKLYRVLLIEDIDTGAIERRDKIEQDGKEIISVKNGLGGILNALDGVGSPSNIIYIFTTNHIDKLDPALIRPGRIDLKLEIGNVTVETLNQFCRFHYGKEILDKTITLKEGLIFGELQTLVMRNYTMEQIIEYVKA